METEEAIETTDIDWRTDYIMRLAKRLYQINLPLSVAAAAVIVISLCVALFTFRPESLAIIPTVGPGLLCELFYYKQSRDGFLKRRVLGWIYSAFFNILCIAGFIGYFIHDDHIEPLIVLAGFYPAFFLGVSVYALYLIWQEKGG